MRFVTVSFLVLVLVVLGCSSRASRAAHAAEQREQAAGVKGVLLDAATNKPLAKCYVQIFKCDHIEEGKVYFSGEPVLEALTNEAGAFAIARVPPGKYLLVNSFEAARIFVAGLGSFQKGKPRVIEVKQGQVLDLGAVPVVKVKDSFWMARLSQLAPN